MHFLGDSESPRKEKFGLIPLPSPRRGRGGWVGAQSMHAGLSDLWGWIFLAAQGCCECCGMLGSIPSLYSLGANSTSLHL